MKFGVVTFPGSNCDQDAVHALRDVLGQPVEELWHGTADLRDCDCVVLPGGFSYGDYLRTGAIARFSPVMSAVAEHAAGGGLVLGICNGFQILCEAGLLPGALAPNAGVRFICDTVHLRVENADTAFTRACRVGQVLRIPIAHQGGRYVCDPETLRDLQAHEQIVLRYCDARGIPSAEANPNGSIDNIAGIVNRQGNVFGLMPHPERASEALLGSEDGRRIFESIVLSWDSARDTDRAEKARSSPVTPIAR